MSARPRDPGTFRVLMGWFWRGYLHRHAGLVAFAMVLMAVEGGMLGALSYMMQPMFDKVFVEGDQAALWWVGFGILGIFIVRAIANVGQRVMLSVVEQRTAAGLRHDLLDHLMTLDGSFHQTHPPGYLLQRVQGDVDAVKALWTAIITGAGRDMISLVILLGVALSVDWVWTLVACIGIPLMLVPANVAQRFVRRRSREARDLGAGLATRLDEVFHGIVPVKLNLLERYQSNRYRALTRRLVRAEVRARIGSAALPGLVDIMAGLGFLGVVVFGGQQIMAGEKTIGEFMSFFTAIGFAFEPLRRLGAISGVWQAAAAALERLKELMETPATVLSPARPVPAPTGTPGVELRDVTLNYGDTPVLRGASLRAAAGQTTALVGASGAGKSTVFNLLTRLIDTSSGQVLVGGTDVRDLALPDLRGLFSVVSQDAALFDDSLRENILLGRSDVTDARLAEVLEAAHVSDFLPNLSDGLDTQVGPRGSALSGGQRQRVAIARALLRDTPILLLDEATSALDAESERTVQQALDRLSKGRTTLVIAHRLSTVRGADKIVVMEKGRVIDEGRHDELLSRGGTYARLHDLQFRNEGPTAEARATKPVADTEPPAPAQPSLWARLFGR
ncbi:ABC transporter ATP-binding protein [Lacimonas salitolerans]|uniref:ABC transporter ATP-binding protein n=1 Tax=Lacimonas salitolerans TaxID=1323750 RepID=A0ABW4EJ23_9RHOB